MSEGFKWYPSDPKTWDLGTFDPKKDTVVKREMVREKGTDYLWEKDTLIDGRVKYTIYAGGYQGPISLYKEEIPY